MGNFAFLGDERSVGCACPGSTPRRQQLVRIRQEGGLQDELCASFESCVLRFLLIQCFYVCNCDFYGCFMIRVLLLRGLLFLLVFIDNNMVINTLKKKNLN